jgi:cobalt-zinc-cadmium efflux system membrane fusion protein
MIGRTFVALIFVAATLSGCGGESEAAREAAAMKAATPNRVQPDGSIRLTDAERGALGLTVEAAPDGELPNATLRFGRIVSPPPNEAQVVSPVTGRITSPPRVQLGASVAAAAVLLEVQPTLDVADRISVGTQAAQRLGDIDAAQRELAKADAEAARARELSPQVVSAAQLQQAETAAGTARAKLEGLQAARAAETTARTQPVPVNAPIAGTIAELTATVGSLVNRGDVLARIVKAGALWVDLSVPPDDPAGDRYELVTPAATVQARLLSRGRLTDANGTRTDRLAIEGPAVLSLNPGATVSVRVGHGTTRGIVIPESAIVPTVDGDTVFVETSASVFVARPVRVDTRFGDRVRVASGLQAGERVVVRGGMALQGELLRAQLRPAG